MGQYEVLKLPYCPVTNQKGMWDLEWPFISLTMYPTISDSTPLQCYIFYTSFSGYSVTHKAIHILYISFYFYIFCSSATFLSFGQHEIFRKHFPIHFYKRCKSLLCEHLSLFVLTCSRVKLVTLKSDNFQFLISSHAHQVKSAVAPYIWSHITSEA